MSTAIFLKSIFFISWTILSNIFTSIINHMIINVHVNCNCMWGTYLHRKTTIYTFRYRRKQMENKVKLTYHCSFICQWILACCVLHLSCHPSVCSICMLIHHSPPSDFEQNYISIFIILVQYKLHVHDYVNCLWGIDLQ